MNRQEYVRAVVKALGGPTRVAYLAGGVSTQTVYNWIAAGRVIYSRPALLLGNAATERKLVVWGSPVTAESLAGLVDPRAPEPDEPTLTGRPKTARKRLRLVEPETAVEAARAKLDAKPLRAYARIKDRNNCPLLMAA